MTGYENSAFQVHPETKCWFVTADIKDKIQEGLGETEWCK
jgi:hypothetical protein